MSVGVIYYHVGSGFAARLAVSLHSLRQHYRGPVAILVDQVAKPLSERIASSLDATVLEVPDRNMRRNGHYCQKASLWRHAPYDRSLFLDADTVVVAPIDELLEMKARVIITHFSDWHSKGRKMSRRIAPLADVKDEKGQSWPFIQALVAAQLRMRYPAINTGVVRFDRDFAGLEAWESITRAISPRFIADELAMQVAFPLWRDDCVVVEDMWNCSPIFGAHKHEAKIWHYHGDKHLRKGGEATWWPAYQAATADNVGGLREWGPERDKHLRRWLVEHPLG